MTATLSKTVADFETTLASAVAIGATSCTLVSVTDDDGVTLAAGTYAMTVDLGNDDKEYFIGTLSGSTISSIQSITRQGAASSGFVRAHRRGAKVVMTDWTIIKRLVNLLDGTTDWDASTPIKYDGTATLSSNNHLATVGYVLSVVAGGAVTFDKQTISVTAGETIVATDLVYLKESDSRWWKVDSDDSATTTGTVVGIAVSGNTAGNSFSVQVSGIVTGLSGLTANSKYYASSTAGGLSLTAGTYELFIGYALTTTTLFLAQRLQDLPTAKEKDALVGSQGTPSSTNKYITADNTSSVTTDQTQTTQNASIDVGEADLSTRKNKIAQSFIPVKTKIRGVALYKGTDTGTFTGTVTIALQADSSGNPSGSNLASRTLTNAEWRGLSAGANNITFSSEYTTLTTGSLYWIVISTSTSDTSNHPTFGTNSAGGYSNGSVKYNNTADGWVAVATIDLYFTTLEGVVSQVVVTDTGGAIPRTFYDVDNMPVPAFQQVVVAVDTITTATDGFPLNTATSNADGSVVVLVYNGTVMRRLARDAKTGMYYVTHSVSSSAGSTINSLVVLGSYVYAFYDGGANIAGYRYALADLTGEAALTITTPIAAAGTTVVTAWTDGLHLYIVASGVATVNVESISGTTLTLVTTNAASADISSASPKGTFFDGTTLYLGVQATPGNASTIVKATNINGSTTSTSTVFIWPTGKHHTSSCLPLFNIDSDRMYVGYSQTYNLDETLDEHRTNIMINPITKP